MKLRQVEYCHNCDQHVTFEFDDTTERQVIICPNCGHEHYRELDQGTLLNIQLDQMHGTGQFRGQLKVARMPKVNMFAFDMNKPVEMCPIEVDTYDVVGMNEEGKAIVKAKNGEPVRAAISDRRWGRDPRQG